MLTTYVFYENIVGAHVPILYAALLVPLLHAIFSVLKAKLMN